MRTITFRSAVVSVLFAAGVMAHMEMKNPLPLASRFDTRNTGAGVDYNNIRPLDPSGSDYPCLNHHLDADQHVTATYAAGQEYPLSISGGAPHGGGSCQLSLSYDNGASFKVIKSILGNCPVQLDWRFTIPADAPSGEGVLFSWTWFNKIGNRELYQNCARVTITGGGAGLSAYPEIFKANIFGNTCVTTEGIDIVFPNPGNQVEYGNPSLQGQAATQVDGCPANNGGGGSQPPVVQPPVVQPPVVQPPVVQPSSSAPSPTRPPNNEGGPSSEPVAPAPTSPTKGPVTDLPVAPSSSIKGPSPIASSAQNPSLTAVNPGPTYVPPSNPGNSSPSTPQPSPPTAPPTSCGEGTILCSTDGLSWSLCSHGTYIQMGSVAAGTVCRNGEIARKSDIGDCPGQDGAMQCLNGGYKWAVCANGVWVGMGSVAEGTVCRDGMIQPDGPAKGRMMMVKRNVSELQEKEVRKRMGEKGKRHLGGIRHAHAGY